MTAETDAVHRFDGLHHVQLAIPAGAEDECRAFWGDALGMSELEKPTALAARGGCWFRGGGVEVHLGVEAGFSPARKAHPGIRVHGIDELAARLTSSGAEVTWDDEFPGHRRFYTFDRVGNRLEFLQPHAGTPAGTATGSGKPMETRPQARQYRVLGKPDVLAAARGISAAANQLGVNEQAELVMNALAGDGWQLDHVGFDPNGLPATLVLSRPTT